jgi:hypothetical protein
MSNRARQEPQNESELDSYVNEMETAHERGSADQADAYASGAMIEDDGEQTAVDPGNSRCQKVVLFAGNEPSPENWISCDLSGAIYWALETQYDIESGRRGEPGSFYGSTARALYRLANGSWLELHRGSESILHWDEDLAPNAAYYFRTPEEAATELLLNGYEPPKEIAHHVEHRRYPPKPDDASEVAGDMPSTMSAKGSDGASLGTPPITKERETERKTTAGAGLRTELTNLPGGRRVRLYDDNRFVEFLTLFDQTPILGYPMSALGEGFLEPSDQNASNIVRMDTIGYSFDQREFAQSFLYRLADGRFVLHSWDISVPAKGEKAWLLKPKEAAGWLDRHHCDIPEDMGFLLAKDTQSEAAVSKPGKAATPVGDDGAALGDDLPRKRRTVEAANTQALNLARKYRRAFFTMSLTKQAKLIGCHWKTWKKTKLYLEAVKDGRIAPPKPKAPKVVTFTDRIEAATGEGEKDEIQKEVAERETRRLIAEQSADAEPSPLEDDLPGRERKAHSRKRL